MTKEQEQLLRRPQLRGGGVGGGSPYRREGIVEGRASWEEVLDLVASARDLLERLRLELSELCTVADFDVVTIRDRTEQGRGLELRLCKTDGSMRCRHYYLSRRRLDQLERLLGEQALANLHEALAKLRDLCRLLGLRSPPSRREPPSFEEGEAPASTEGEFDLEEFII